VTGLGLEPRTHALKGRSSINIKSMDSSTVGMILKIVSNLEISINFLTLGCAIPVSTKVPCSFHNLFAVRIALNPELSTYLTSVKSRIRFFTPSLQRKTNSDFKSGAISELRLSSFSCRSEYFSCLSITNFIFSRFDVGS